MAKDDTILSPTAIQKHLNLKVKNNIPAAINELVNAGLLLKTPVSELYSINKTMAFDKKNVEEINFNISIKIKTIEM